MDWDNAYILIAASGPDKAAVFMFYILFFVLAVWNIITSIFVEKALKIAQPDIDSLMLEKRRKDAVDAKELDALFRKMDIDGNSVISMEEFLHCVKSPHFEQ